MPFSNATIQMAVDQSHTKNFLMLSLTEVKPLMDHHKDKLPKHQEEEQETQNLLISSEPNSSAEEQEELLDLESHSELWMTTILEV
jgi:hypothetical protein